MINGDKAFTRMKSLLTPTLKSIIKNILDYSQRLKNSFPHKASDAEKNSTNPQVSLVDSFQLARVAKLGQRRRIQGPVP